MRFSFKPTIVSKTIKFRLAFCFQVLLVATVTIIDSIRVILLMATRGNPSVFYKHSRQWSKKLLKIIGIKVEIISGDPIPIDKSYIYVSNHASLTDIPILLASINDNIRIMYKKELEKIPIFGWGLRRSPFIPVVRQQARKAMASLEDALVSFKEGGSVLVFPEGTRSSDGTLGSFKRGAFFLAIQSGKPIVPVTVVGSSKILPSGKYIFNKGKVKLIIGSPISINSNAPSKQEERQLMNDVYNIIQKNLANNNTDMI